MLAVKTALEQDV